MIRRLTGLAVLCLVVVTILVLLKIDPGAGSGALSSPSWQPLSCTRESDR
jgi:preprotein translocase subunit SecG